MFKNLCGTKSYKNVVVLTTFWDEINEELGQGREAQLKGQYFKEFVEGGARFVRNNQTVERTHEVLKHIFTLDPTYPLLAIELGRQKIVLEKTAAGSVQREEVEWMIAKHKQEVAEIEEEMRAAKDYNAATKQALEKERVEMQKKLAKWETERTELRRGLDEARSSWKQVENKIKLERSKIRPLAPLIAENSNSIVVNASAAGGDAAAFCLITPPIAPGIDKSEMAFASVKFTLHSHDQGKWGFSGSTSSSPMSK
jgi:hypothetical protein